LEQGELARDLVVESQSLDQLYLEKRVLRLLVDEPLDWVYLAEIALLWVVEYFDQILPDK